MVLTHLCITPRRTRTCVDSFVHTAETYKNLQDDSYVCCPWIDCKNQKKLSNIEQIRFYLLFRVVGINAQGPVCIWSTRSATRYAAPIWKWPICMRCPGRWPSLALWRRRHFLQRSAGRWFDWAGPRPTAPEEGNTPNGSAQGGVQRSRGGTGGSERRHGGVPASTLANVRMQSEHEHQGAMGLWILYLPRAEGS